MLCPFVIIDFVSVFCLLLLINEGSILKIIDGNAFGRRECKSVPKGDIKELRGSFGVAQNIGVPDTAVDVEWSRCVPRWRVREASLIASILSDKALVLPSVQRFFLERPFHFGATAEMTRKFADEIFRGTKDCDGRRFSCVMPFQICLLDSELMLRRRVGNDPWTVNRNNGVCAHCCSLCRFSHFIGLVCSDCSIKNGSNGSKPSRIFYRTLVGIAAIIAASSIFFCYLVLSKEFFSPFPPNLIVLILAFVCGVYGFFVLIDILMDLT